MRLLKNRAWFSHMRSFVFTDADHTVNDVFFAVSVGDVSADFAVGKCVVAHKRNGHIEHFAYLELDIDDALSLFVFDIPNIGFFLAVFVREYDGRHREGFVVNPNHVLVVLALVNGLIAREVESKISLGAVVVDLSHRGEPIVVRVEGIEALVVVDDTHGTLVGGVDFAVDGDSARCLEKVLFTVQSVDKVAFFVLAEGHNAVCKRRNALKAYIYRKLTVFAFGKSFGVRFSVQEVVLDLVFAVFGLAIAIVADELRCDVRFFLGNEVAPAVNLVFLFVVPHEDGKAHRTRVVNRADKCAFVEMHFKRFPFDEASGFQKVGHILSARLYAIEKIEVFKRSVKRAEMHFAVFDDRLGRRGGQTSFAYVIG